MNNLQAQGRSCYKRGDYKKAIDIFDRAIGRAPSVQLLDNRAACYEKLEDYPTALKDAKKAIQLHREDAVGYLRAGRVLTKMGKQSVALEIYTHGLKCIKHVGQGFEQLRKVQQELMDELCPPKSVDPLTVLPRELAEAILEHLSFRQRMNACLISKPWSQFVRSTPNLWQHLDLSASRRKVRSAFISRAINVGQQRLKMATLGNLYDFDKALFALAKHCPIEELTLRDCGLQSQNLHRPLATARNLRSLKLTHGTLLNAFELRPLLKILSERLEVFECTLSAHTDVPGSGVYHEPCPRLKSLQVTFGDGNDHSEFFIGMAEHFPTLHELVVRQARDLRIPGTLLGADLRSCTSLRHLGFHLWSGFSFSLSLPRGLTNLEICHTPSPPAQNVLPHLDSLAVQRCHALRLIRLLDSEDSSPGTDEALGRASTQQSLLRHLSITESDLGALYLEPLLKHRRLRDLESLCLASCLAVDDKVVALLASAKLEKLRVVDLTATTLTGVGVKDLILATQLDTLILNDCTNVSPDAVAWARAKGVAVKYRMSSNGTASGRKVRY